MSPLIRNCQKKHWNFFILHTNQHYSPNLDKIFFQELELPQPKYNLNVGSGTHAEEVAKMLVGIEKILIEEQPRIVLVEGDTNTVFAGALAAAKLHLKVGHLEAGLRSYCREMPEEINRVLTDHCSDLLFAPTKEAQQTLLKEGILQSQIFVTGNTIVDAVLENVKLAQKKSKILKILNLKKQEYFLVTLHREENVDNKPRLKDILKGLDLIARTFQLPIIYPIHPRALKMLQAFHLTVPSGITLIEPLGFFDFLSLESQAKLVLTDSGGVQEETCILKVPCVTLRDNTERPETVKAGSNLVSGTRPQNILTAVKTMIKKPRTWPNPFGDGQAASKILQIILTSKS